MIVEKDASPCSIPLLVGNRIVDVNFFIQQIRKLAAHDIACTMGKMQFVGEKRSGLVSSIKYHCQVCERTIHVNTQKSGNDLNKSLVWSSSSIGNGFAQTEELLSVMISWPFYKKVESKVHNDWEQLLFHDMHKNAMEEKALAIEAGHMEQGFPYITVIVDGDWAKRSYGHSYLSLSGVACIIGKRTKKLLYVGVKNKFCYTCVTSSNKEHTCYKNFSGTSASMEQAIIVEGFNKSECEYGLRYKYVIGDGDSSVYTRILENVTYGRYVFKMECANHVTRAFTSSLYKLIKNTKFDVKARQIVKSKIPNLSSLIRTIIARSSDVKLLKTDLKNSIRHSFGDHVNCRKEVCSRESSSAANQVVLLESASVFAELVKICDNVIRKADRLCENVTTNYAERYMSMIAKFTGGKRTNLCSKGVYQSRCFAAGLAFNQGVSFHLRSTKFKKPFLLQYCCKRRIYKKKIKRKPVCQTDDPDYGTSVAEPDMSPDELKLSKNKIMAELSSINTEDLERLTRGQNENILWHQARRNRITASNFGKICSRRRSTPCHNIIKDLLYRNSDALRNNKAIKYGVENEQYAKEKFSVQQNIKIFQCGLFVSNEHYFLGASPDGVTENDELIEIKCLYSIKEKKIKDAVKQNKNLCVTLDSDGQLSLKEKNNYYYQIQGQLNICNKDVCYLILYTDVDLEFIKIRKDVPFWQNTVVPKLKNFWEENILRELANPRIPRGMKARDNENIPIHQSKKIKL